MTYEQLKIARKDSGFAPSTQAMATVEYIGMAAMSKIFATISTYPYQVVKSRMQADGIHLKDRYGTVIQTIKSIKKYFLH